MLRTVRFVIFDVMANISRSNRKESILAEAAILFKQKGFSATSVRELAEKVGIEAASLYNHIENKEELLELICFRVAHQYVSHIEQIESSHAGAVEKLKALIALHVRMIIDSPNEVSVANNDWKNLSGAKKEQYKEIRRGYEKRVADLIQLGIDEGHLKPVNVSVALFTLLSSLRWIELWYRAERDISPETLENDMITLLIDGIKK